MKRGLMKLAVAAVCLGWVCSFSFAERDGKEGKVAKPPESRKEAKKISVQLFVVEAQMDALYKEGADPLSAGTGKVTVEQIVNCIEKDKAGVISGISVSTNDGEEARESCEKRFYVKYESGDEKGGGRDIRFHKYSTQKKLTVRPFISSNGKIRTELNYLETYFDLDNVEETPQMPLGSNERSLSTSVMLNPGKPEIISGFQNENKGEFIIVTADIAE